MENVTLKGDTGVYTFCPFDKTTIIGEGGIGIVYKGTNNKNDKVAVKVLKPQISKNITSLQRAQQTAGIKLKHKNLLEMLDFIPFTTTDKNGDEVTIYHVVSKFVEGIPLSKRIEQFENERKSIENEFSNSNTTNTRTSVNRKLQEHDNERLKFMINVFSQVLDGLEILHSNQIFHRDIDPTNIMLLKDNTPVLMDFDIAKIDSNTYDEEKKNRTELGTLLGKVRYAPPEHIKDTGEKSNATSDIYSIGITLYESLIGKPPFDGNTQFDIEEKQIYSEIPSNSRLKDDVLRILKKATAKRQTNRFQTTKELKSSLLNCLSKPSPATSSNFDKWKTLSFVFIGLTAIFLITSIVFIVQFNNYKSMYYSAVNEKDDLSSQLSKLSNDYQNTQSQLSNIQNEVNQKQAIEQELRNTCNDFVNNFSSNWNNDEAWGKLAKAFNKANDWEKATGCYTIAIVLDPNDSEWKGKASDNGDYIKQVLMYLKIKDDERIGDLGDKAYDNFRGSPSVYRSFFAYALMIQPNDSEWERKSKQ